MAKNNKKTTTKTANYAAINEFLREVAETVTTKVKLPSGHSVKLEGFNETGNEDGLVSLAKKQDGIVKFSAPKLEYVGDGQSIENTEVSPSDAGRTIDKCFNIAFAMLAEAQTPAIKPQAKRASVKATTETPANA